ncbi:hypothetical protein V500_05600 [Pseudogymnoascus sp. VKM F-4518 (FW-2643)]|nr:hypothetical protein V500_05600 [Pseudogymnoascus sp. VKM F-4518 (FW-2643)]
MEEQPFSGPKPSSPVSSTATGTILASSKRDTFEDRRSRKREHDRKMDQRKRHKQKEYIRSLEEQEASLIEETITIKELLKRQNKQVEDEKAQLEETLTMSYSKANVKPPGLRKRKPTITVTDDELQRQKHSKMTAGDGPESIDSTATAEPTDGINLVDPTIIEPDEENDSTVYPSMADMLAKMKLERRRATEKLTSQGRRVLKETLISERCTSCESPIPDSALESRAMDVPDHQHDQINPNELEKHQSRLDAINSKPEGEKAEVDKLECAASSLLTVPATEAPQYHRQRPGSKAGEVRIKNANIPSLMSNNVHLATNMRRLRPTSTACELRLQNQRGPAAISRSIPAVICGATNTMKEPTDELEAPGNVNGGPRLPDRHADSEVAKEDKRIKTATTVFKMPAPCISCKAPVTCDNRRGAMFAAYGILLGIDQVTDDMLRKAATLFNDNYGTWGPQSHQPGKPVTLSIRRLREQYLPDTADSSYIREHSGQAPAPSSGLWQVIEVVPATASATLEAPEDLERQAPAALILHTWIASQL